MQQKMTPKIKDARECLRKYRENLTRQQCRTLMGQIKAGDINGAMNGLDRLLARKKEASTK
jgi:hypothetical protein